MRLLRTLADNLKFLVTGLLLFLVLRSVEPSKLLNDLRSLRLGWLVLIVALYWIGQMLCAQRWRLFATGFGMGGKYARFVQTYFVCMFFNTGLPSLIGGDAIKAYMVSRSSGKPLKMGLASVLQDRASGWLTLIIYGTAASFAWPMKWRNLSLTWVYLVIWVGMLAAVALVWQGEKLYSGLLVPGKRSGFQKALGSVADFHRALATMRLRPGAVVQVTAISFANSALVLWIYQQIAGSLGHDVSLVAFSALIPLITLIVMMPISLGGLGVREWAYIEALGLLGIPRSAALVIALTTSTILIVGNLAGALFLPAVPRQLRRDSRVAAKSELSG